MFIKLLFSGILITSALAFAPNARCGHFHTVHGSSLGMVNRRRLIQNVVRSIGVTGIIASQGRSVMALDFDAFINDELKDDTKNCDPKRDPKCRPILSEDEALCQYGQSGDARKEACKRVKAAGKDVPKANSQGKSLGGAYAM